MRRVRLIAIVAALAAALVATVAVMRVPWHGVMCRPSLYLPKIALKLRAIVLKVGMCIPDAERALLLLDDGLRAAGVPYWLSEGTALGMFRAGALILGDDDIDIAVRHEHRERLLRIGIPALRALGFEPIWIRNEGLFVELHHTALGISVDIDIVSENSRCLTVQGAKYGSFIPCRGVSEIADTLTTRSALGREFRMPSKPYYERLYGPTWHTPI
jgi:hypothetical protein